MSLNYFLFDTLRDFSKKSADFANSVSLAYDGTVENEFSGSRKTAIREFDVA